MTGEPRCQNCGIPRPTRRVVYHQNIGLIFMRWTKAADAEVCLTCLHRLFWEYTVITSVAGWWGMISFVVTPVFLIQNTARYLYYVSTNGSLRRRTRELRLAAALAFLTGALPAILKDRLLDSLKVRHRT